MINLMKNTSLYRKIKAFTLLEVMLSISILSIIVYSLFVVFNRTTEVMDEVFVGTHHYEQVMKFFEKLKTELTGAMVGATSNAEGVGEVYEFLGGPHWLEFGTMITNQYTIEDYIKKGVNQLIATPKKIHYFAAQNRTYDTLKGIPDDLFKTHIFRIIPEGNLHKNVLAHYPSDTLGYGSVSSNDPIVFYVLSNPIPLWLEENAVQDFVLDVNNIQAINGAGQSLNNFISDITEVLMCRAIKFRYYYFVKSKDDETLLYSQDWWDSRIRYPHFTYTESNPTSQDIYEHYYSDVETNVYKKDFDLERRRRLSSPDFKFHDSRLLYGAESSKKTPGNEYEGFRSFDKEFNNENYLLKTELPFVKASDKEMFRLAVLADGAEDPWFNKPPAMVEITLYMYDKSKGALAYNTDTGIFKTKSGGNPDSTEISNAYKGDVFSMLIYIRNSSSSISNYKRDLYQE